MSIVTKRLAGVDLFSRLDDGALERIASSGTTMRFRAGDRIVEQGGTDRSLHVLIDGTAEVLVHGEPVRTLEPGAYYGETALIDNEPRSATIVAGEGGAKVLVVSALAFDPMLEDPSIARGLLTALTQRVRRLEASRTTP